MGMNYSIMSAAGGGYYFIPYTYTYERNAAVRRYSDNGEEGYDVTEKLLKWNGDSFTLVAE